MPRLTTRQRRAKLKACGRGCFGDADGPKARRAGHPRYPICGSGCSPTCTLVKRAYMRAAQQHEPGIRGAMKALGQRMGCPWAKRG